jgi:hypothetical protein
VQRAITRRPTPEAPQESLTWTVVSVCSQHPALACDKAGFPVEGAELVLLADLYPAKIPHRIGVRFLRLPFKKPDIMP